ncbi:MULTISPECIES: histidine phosphatase family protein [unclassified Streptomyces]|uniref:SixA phosphatase family protein n=1 Tax=unclassified Streptomyces TaxID=2593676 RepID=UPI00225AAFCD|nr:histidine phosphatase family protein [Streptomyces sp. NBC_00047]MCX5613468.1 histidine phosphatase family protein [Streptomyces sp. NBC_00047]
MHVEPSARAGGERRRLLLVRHAKAVPKGRVEDFDRPLSDRGRKNAPDTGRWLAGAGYTADLALCSPSRRTRQTWELILPALPSPPPTVYDDRLYNAAPSGLVDVLSARGGELGSLLLVGHNSGIHELASVLCGSGPVELLERLREGFPTSSVVVVDLADAWDGLTPGRGSLTDLWSPTR